MSNVLELFGSSTKDRQENWFNIVKLQKCPFTRLTCFKVRKSQPEISIGTCTVKYGRDEKGIIICPKRLLQRNQVFMDCIHLLSVHEPGNELHVVSEIGIPGGSVDYFLVSTIHGKVKDFVAIEFQTLDTTGTVWPARQRLLSELGFDIDLSSIENKSFGMNWKMTAKTILVQLHHKIGTIENLNKHLVLIIQDYFLDYIKKKFNFGHLNEQPRNGDSFHIHSYQLIEQNQGYDLELYTRLSTDSDGVATCMGLQAEANIELGRLFSELEKRISQQTLLSFQ